MKKTGNNTYTVRDAFKAVKYSLLLRLYVIL
jgi:hypothetical protein